MEYESKGGKDKNLSPEDYFDIIKPFLRDMINNHKTHGEWKIQLIMQINFISSLGTEEFCIMYAKGDNAEIMIGIETDDIINELFKSLLERYQHLETRMEGSRFFYENVDLLYYSLHKISLNRGRSYIDSPSWIKNKKVIINPKSQDNECLKHAIIIALNHEKIKNYPERISNLKPFFDHYNWKDIEFPSHSKDWKKLEENNKTIALNILFVPYNTEQIWQAYISKYNHERDNQVILLMITDKDENWHYLAVKSLSKLLRRITSNHHRDFYCLNYLHLYRTKEKLEKPKMVCKDHDYCHVKKYKIKIYCLKTKIITKNNNEDEIITKMKKY